MAANTVCVSVCFRKAGRRELHLVSAKHKSESTMVTLSWEGILIPQESHVFHSSSPQCFGSLEAGLADSS